MRGNDRNKIPEGKKRLESIAVVEITDPFLEQDISSIVIGRQEEHTYV